MITEESRRKMGWRKGLRITKYEKNCEICSKIFTTVPSSKHQYTCSRKCNSLRRKKSILKKECKFCKKDIFTTSYGRKYCDTRCKMAGMARDNRERFLNKTKWGVWRNYKEAKKFFLEKYNSCQLCKWNIEPAILEIHHVDRNRKNNTESNLLLLCPNCHSVEHFNKSDGQFKNNKGRKNASNVQGKEDKKCNDET